jgi:hypothetical protein
MNTFKKTAQTLLLKADFLGIGANFEINKSTLHKTIFGGIISLFILFLSIAGLVYFGRELYEKKRPLVTTQNTFDEDPREFELDPKNFNFFVGIEDPSYNYFVDNTIYNITMKLGMY